MEDVSMKILTTAFLIAFGAAMFGLGSVSGFLEPAYATGCDDPRDQNNGWGNGDQNAPGNSEDNNGAENEGGNANNMGDAPGNSGH